MGFASAAPKQRIPQLHSSRLAASVILSPIQIASRANPFLIRCIPPRLDWPPTLVRVVVGCPRPRHWCERRARTRTIETGTRRCLTGYRQAFASRSASHACPMARSLNGVGSFPTLPIRQRARRSARRRISRLIRRFPVTIRAPRAGPDAAMFDTAIGARRPASLLPWANRGDRAARGRWRRAPPRPTWCSACRRVAPPGHFDKRGRYCPAVRATTRESAVRPPPREG